jgi:hypothetical protein
MTVEISAWPVVVFGSSCVSVTCQDLRVAKRHARVKGDGWMSQRVRTDVRWIRATFAIRTTIR